MISIFSLPGNVWTHLLDNTWAYLKMLQFHGDNVLRHNIPGQPMMNIVAAILLGLGIIHIFWKRTPAGWTAILTILIFMIPRNFIDSGTCLVTCIADSSVCMPDFSPSDIDIESKKTSSGFIDGIDSGGYFRSD